MSRDAELFELDPMMCRTLLRTQHVGRLVTAGVDPHVVPVNYVVEDHFVVFNTRAGAVAIERVGEAVLFEVDMFDDRTRSGWSVVVHGNLRRPPPDLDVGSVETWAPGERPQMLVVAIETLTGRLLRGAIDAPIDAPSGYL
jgi:hypothetical protein